MKYLPNEIINYIFDFLNNKELRNIRLVCLLWNNIFKSNIPNIKLKERNYIPEKICIYSNRQMYIDYNKTFNMYNRETNVKLTGKHKIIKIIQSNHELICYATRRNNKYLLFISDNNISSIKITNKSKCLLHNNNKNLFIEVKNDKFIVMNLDNQFILSEKDESLTLYSNSKYIYNYSDDKLICKINDIILFNVKVNEDFFIYNIGIFIINDHINIYNLRGQFIDKIFIGDNCKLFVCEDERYICIINDNLVKYYEY